jgi:hypothetical protein
MEGGGLVHGGNWRRGTIGVAPTNDSGDESLYQDGLGGGARRPRSLSKLAAGSVWTVCVVAVADDRPSVRSTLRRTSTHRPSLCAGASIDNCFQPRNPRKIVNSTLQEIQGRFGFTVAVSGGREDSPDDPRFIRYNCTKSLFRLRATLRKHVRAGVAPFVLAVEADRQFLQGSPAAKSLAQTEISLPARP